MLTKVNASLSNICNKVGKDVDKSSLAKSSSFLLKQNCLEVVQLLPRGLDSFWDAWGWFVACQFRTRYCGHTLSRLAEIRHNKTKQSGFPTIRRKELKSRGEFEYNSTCPGLVGTCRLLLWGCRVCAIKG